MVRDNNGLGNFKLLLAGAACVIAGIILASSFNLTPFSRADKGGAENLATAAGVKSIPLPLASALQSPFVAVAKKAGPAVVNIRSKRYVESNRNNFQTPYDDFFKDFFPEFRRMEPDKKQQKVEGQGSGFIIDKKGYILTNNHVVAGNPELTVKMSDSREFSAEVVGADPKSDVAVIKLKGLKDDLPESEVAVLGNSDEIQVGDYAVAIGNPFGLERTVTQGIISYKGRTGLDIQGGGPMYQDFIQTDASINFGNSGGPLVNLRGEVVGINTAINPAGQGIGFAIPINLAKKVAEQLIDHGKVVRGYLGVLPQEITPNLAEGLGIEEMNGVLVAKVEDNTPASRAGLMEGDVIIKFDGQEVPNVAKFRQVVADTRVGTDVSIVVIREKKQRTIKATLGELPREEAQKDNGKEDNESKSWMGIKKVLAVESETAQRAGIREKEGVLVADLESGSPADEAGLAEGDVIKKINSREVKTVADYHRLRKSETRGEKAVLFLIKRGQNTLFIAVKPK
ncbi:Do family serine endopeptidase [candidate division TA06 bacterium]|uniref:Do family serine endopeptidase n=1 Tax=candidate division TA06 bacterium TaxID=2250710 RepID=A0A933I8L7_UNCT6|nr:Do family serine endopeptidase [candidate division TA06 bacterium]